MSDAFKEWQGDATPHSVPVEVCFDRQLVADLEEIQRTLKEASSGMLEASPELEQHALDLQKQVAAKTRTLRFGSIGRGRWKDLEAQHPPTDEQRERIGWDLAWNPESFPAAALVATCTEPGLTEEQASWLTTELPEFVFDRIWAACLAANILGGDEKKAVSTVVVRRSENV